MSRKVVYDSSDVAQIQAAEKDQADREGDLKWIMSSPRGRRWMYDMVHQQCHIASPSHFPGDTHTTAFNEGARAVGEAVLEEIRTSHFPAFMKMMEEQHDPVN